MPWTRRRFIGAGIGAAAALALTGGALLRTRLRDLPQAFRELSQQVAPGALDQPTLNGLMAMTRALLQVPIEPLHYEDFFRWRAQNAAGYRGVYRQCMDMFDRAAQRAAGRRYVECDAPTQRALIDAALDFRGGGWRRTWNQVFHFDGFLYDRYVARELLRLFSVTDAWVLTGYDAWRGMPRGFERYRAPPADAGTADG